MLRLGIPGQSENMLQGQGEENPSTAEQLSTVCCRTIIKKHTHQSLTNFSDFGEL